MRFISILLIFVIIGLIYPTTGQAAPGVSANNAILIEQSTGRILFEKQAHEKESIASITKIMTAIIAIESGKMNEEATTSRKAIHTEGSSIYLEQGEKMLVEDLVYGLMLRSGNDAAVVIGEHVGGSEEGFVHLMNEKAKWLGMTNTHFDNPHGLDSDTHYSTAYDMAILMQYAMQNEQFQTITGATTYLSKSRTYSWQNKNKLLTQFYEYCIGGKTGYTKKTGRTLVSSAEKNGMKLIAVTLNAPDDWRDHIGMFEWGFENYSLESIGEKGKSAYSLPDIEEPVIGQIISGINYPLAEKEREKVTVRNYILKHPTMAANDIIGKKVYYFEEKQIGEVFIYKGNEKRNEANLLSDTLNIFQNVVGWP
ncbi:D-alanyl-D-alanine carboxypeptidase family protein [Oceanobacillus manasiensis]|uniref:D-alanyl-D-alanine carboxypeptidase family protein n=1 Tax=Oceanobacillus manasiensis TaxID=586413 RepID=UPI0005A602CF|nr:D-alanyl-D-alanine carboxypeptidase family protein [Oceanobacillus manasiensis]